ncbi:Hypothetical protein PHPALM_3631 [Phytophthora palmivora]|uniref:Uncharacterized protein n=1 Tax=Phytophthora palmivora TaxID=4796 RepID=A0A2P4YLX8_9STRA|nr:Hypothetical protein PHPALM_3631 [Phytophthora palmivora]
MQLMLTAGLLVRTKLRHFEASKIHWLCKLEWGTSVETVTEDRIVKDLDKIVGNVMNDAIIDVDSLFKSGLKIDLREKDVKARVHALQSTFSTLTGIKEKCKILKQYLEPTALRDAVDSHQRLVDSASKADEQEGLRAGKGISATVKKQRTDSSRANPTRGTRGDYNHQRIVATATSAVLPASNKKPRTGCFHCGKDHWLSHCPDLDEAGKEALLAERKAKKGTGSNTGNRSPDRTTTYCRDVMLTNCPNWIKLLVNRSNRKRLEVLCSPQRMQLMSI